jgi:hypothetical protein
MESRHENAAGPYFPLVSYWAHFRFDPAQWADATPEERALVELVDGWRCFVSGSRYFPEADPGEGRVWAKFKGAHHLDPFGGWENRAPVPVEALEPFEFNYTDAEIDASREQQKLLGEKTRELYGAYDSDVPCQDIDLGSMRGFAGLILPDASSGVRYSWLVEGVALGGASVRGYFVPIMGRAAARLNRYGDNIYTNAAELDVALLNDLLAECLGGWEVDPELTDVAVEAAVWLRCVRPLQTADEWVEAGKTIPEDDEEARGRHWRRSSIYSPFSGVGDDDLQADLIGRRSILVWENSD